jgi:hypothetical protein
MLKPGASCAQALTPSRRMQPSAPAYNHLVDEARPPDTTPVLDTAGAVEAQQIAIWRSLSTVQIAQLVSGASRAVRILALAGLRARFPSAAEPELTARLAVITVGHAVARQAYPQVSNLET